MPETGRRRAKRHEVKDVHGSLLFRVQVSVVNVSLTGMAVETTERLRVGRSYQIRLTDSDRAIDVDGEVKWCRMTKTQKVETGDAAPVYRAGISFDQILSTRAHELLKFMESHVLLTLEKRIFGRFKLKPESPVDVSSRYEFLVQKISFSGMLIQTELLPHVETHFDMELRLANGPLEVRGRVAYAKQIGGSKDSPTSEVGVEFMGMKPEGKALLEEFIVKHISDD